MINVDYKVIVEVFVEVVVEILVEVLVEALAEVLVEVLVEVLEELFGIRWISGQDNPADAMTKANQEHPYWSTVVSICSS